MHVAVDLVEFDVAVGRDVDVSGGGAGLDVDVAEDADAADGI